MQRLKIFSLIIVVLAPFIMAANIYYERATAPIYKVRIEGFDPRDLLYGHYLMFRFTPERSADRDTFPEDFDLVLDGFDGRYYIPERHAYTLEEYIRDQKRIMEIEVGVPDHGNAFLGDLYIDGLPMRDVLRNLEHGVDLDHNAEG